MNSFPEDWARLPTLLSNVNTTLIEVKAELVLSRNREETLRKEIERSRLLTEKQAEDYLQRDAETLRYYRNLGLSSIKIGRDRWYVKGVIDDWLASGTVNRRRS